MIVDVGEAGADRPRVRCAELQEALHALLVDQVHRHLAVELLAEPAGEAATLGAVGRVVATPRAPRVALLEIPPAAPCAPHPPPTLPAYPRHPPARAGAPHT